MGPSNMGNPVYVYLEIYVYNFCLLTKLEVSMRKEFHGNISKINVVVVYIAYSRFHRKLENIFTIS